MAARASATSQLNSTLPHRDPHPNVTQMPRPPKNSTEEKVDNYWNRTDTSQMVVSAVSFYVYFFNPNVDETIGLALLIINAVTLYASWR